MRATPFPFPFPLTLQTFNPPIQKEKINYKRKANKAHTTHQSHLA